MIDGRTEDLLAFVGVMATLGTGGAKETTEWEDILREKGVIPEKTQEEIVEEQLGKLVDDAVEAYDPHANKNVKELDEELEEADSEEERILEKYRAARVAELKQDASRPRYGPGVRQIYADEWKTEVTNATEDAYVVVLLTQEGIEACKLALQLLRELATKFVYTKFLACKATDAIKNYPDSKCPTILVYKAGKILVQFVGLDRFRGLRSNADDLEWALSKVGAVHTDMDEPPNQEEKGFNIKRV
ncbi:Viral IAP-associated factor-like [Porphyridium purpureum]|uniref:Viral IAP-associated factor-like n=1 Tax=Porphyridium purpureum TaxID=35688 RepID=A0A5J4YW14_PORPP|nr:Viral IAP-associated factor-like [Porphyridium purpureum]|eukprot:POR5525..scf227_4